jgi:hypothetical protein
MRGKRFVSQAIEICCNPKKLCGQISYAWALRFQSQGADDLGTRLPSGTLYCHRCARKLFITTPAMFLDVIGANL